QIIRHMNNDHSDALCHHCGGGPAEMAGIDADGFDLLKAGKKLRFTFASPIRNMEEARQALVAMAKPRSSGPVQLCTVIVSSLTAHLSRGFTNPVRGDQPVGQSVWQLA